MIMVLTVLKIFIKQSIKGIYFILYVDSIKGTNFLKSLQETYFPGNIYKI